MWGRAAVVALVVVATTGAARAQRLRKVQIDTEPTGATIYINSKDDGPRGESPLEIELPPGEYTVLAELDRYNPEFAPLTVSKPGKRDRTPVTINVQLTVAMARVRVEGAPARATVKIDEENALPVADYEDGFDVTAGAHTVVVELGARTLATEYIDVESGTEQLITVRPAFTGKGGGDDDDDDDDDGDDDDGDGTSSVSSAFDPRTGRSGPIIAVGPLFDFNWRTFAYRDNETPMTNLGISQYGPLVGLSIELNPFRLTGVRPLHPLALVLAGGRGFAQPVKTDDPGNELDITTFWQRFQAGLRYRFGLGKIDLDLDGGYAIYQYRYNGNVDDIERVPDTSYQTVRFGARLGVRLGAVTPYIGGENRIVMSGGVLETRFTTMTAERGRADTTGYAFRGGLDLALWGGKIVAKLEGHYGKFNWTFTNVPATSMFRAGGGTDTIYGTTVVIGYAY